MPIGWKLTRMAKKLRYAIASRVKLNGFGNYQNAVIFKVRAFSLDFPSAEGQVTAVTRETGYAGVTSKYIGTCKQHNIKGPWFSSEVPFRKRWELMWKPVGGNSREFVMFLRKHYPFRCPIDVIKFFIQVLFPKPFEVLKR